MTTWLRRVARWRGWLLAGLLVVAGAVLTLPSLLPWHHPLVSRAAVVAGTRAIVGPTASIATKYVVESDLRSLGVNDPNGGNQGFWVVLSSSDKLSPDPFFYGHACIVGGCASPTFTYLRDDQSGLDRIGLGPTALSAGFAELPDRAFAEWLPSPGSYWWGVVLTIAGCLLAARMFVPRGPRRPGTAAQVTPPVSAAPR
jgi:hypothetical protein